MQRDTRFIVNTGREAIAEYVVSEVASRGWSYGEIVRRSGGHIKSASTLVNIVNGNVRKVSEDTLRGLAKAFEVKEDEVFAIYRGKSPTEPDRAGQKVLDFYNEMSPTARRHFELIGEALWRESKRMAKSSSDLEFPPIITHRLPVARSTEKKKRA